MNVSPRCYCGGNHGFVCFDMDGSTYNWFCSKLCRQVWRVTRGFPKREESMSREKARSTTKGAGSPTRQKLRQMQIS
jgi:hypothetical protein